MLSLGNSYTPNTCTRTQRGIGNQIKEVEMVQMCSMNTNEYLSENSKEGEGLENICVGGNIT